MRLGGSSFVITPGQGRGRSRRATAPSWTATAAEHVREAIPVLASYCDALGIRAFAGGHDLAADLAETRSSSWRSCATSRWSTSSRRSTIRARRSPTGRRWTTSACRARGKFVLSWVYHPRALPLAVPAATVHMAAQRGMDVVVLRPEGYALPDAVMQQGARGRGGERRLGDRDAPTATTALAGAHVRVCQGMGLAAALRRRRRRSARCAARSPTGACARAGSRSARSGLSFHALPAGASQRRGRRRSARRTAQPRGREAAQPHGRADGGAAPLARRGARNDDRTQGRTGRRRCARCAARRRTSTCTRARCS